MLFNSSFTAAAIAAAATLAATGAFAQEGGTPLPPPKVNAITQKVLDNPDLTEPTKGIRTLQDYIVQEKEMWEFLFQNHPIFATYGKDGRVVFIASAGQPPHGVPVSSRPAKHSGLPE